MESIERSRKVTSLSCPSVFRFFRFTTSGIPNREGSGRVLGLVPFLSSSYIIPFFPLPVYLLMVVSVRDRLVEWEVLLGTSFPKTRSKRYSFGSVFL